MADMNNGVQMPGPMQSGFENGWNAIGEDMSGIPSSFQGEYSGVQLPGGPDEAGWNYGEDMSGLAGSQEVPMTNQDFGVLEGMSPSFDGDDALYGQVIGRVPGSNYDGVQPGDIMSVFHAVSSDGGASGASIGSGYDSMQGIVFGRIEL